MWKSIIWIKMFSVSCTAKISHLTHAKKASQFLMEGFQLPGFAERFFTWKFECNERRAKIIFMFMHNFLLHFFTLHLFMKAFWFEMFICALNRESIKKIFYWILLVSFNTEYRTSKKFHSAIMLKLFNKSLSILMKQVAVHNVKQISANILFYYELALM
jgi:hypothetical protein